MLFHIPHLLSATKIARHHCTKSNRGPMVLRRNVANRVWWKTWKSSKLNVFSSENSQCSYCCFVSSRSFPATRYHDLLRGLQKFPSGRISRRSVFDILFAPLHSRRIYWCDGGKRRRWRIAEALFVWYFFLLFLSAIQQLSDSIRMRNISLMCFCWFECHCYSPKIQTVHER